jgi:hypothetical protein
MNINQFNPAGLSALAGNNFPNLNLKPVVYDPSGYGQGLFAGQLAASQLQQKYDQQNLTAEIDRYKEGQANNRNEADNKSNLLKQLLSDDAAEKRNLFTGNVCMRGQNITYQNNLANQDLNTNKYTLDQYKTGLDERRAAVQEGQLSLNQKTAEENQKVKMQEYALKKLKLDMDKEEKDLNKRGALATMLYQNYSPELVKKALEAGIINEEEAKAIGPDVDETTRNTNLQLGMLSSKAALDGKLKVGEAVSQNPGLDKALNGKMATLVMENGEVTKKLNDFMTFSDNALQQLKEVPGYSLGPIATSIKLDKLDPKAQVLQSSLSSMMLMAKDIVGLKGGAQGMTEGEWEMIKSVAGGTFQNKYSLEQVINTLRKATITKNRNLWKESDGVMKQSDKYYDNWRMANPEPKPYQYYLVKQDNPDASDEDIMAALKQHGIKY